MKNENVSIINQIINEVYKLPYPKLRPERESQIRNLVSTVVNGDILKTHLVIDVKISNSLGVYVYLLTNNRFIVITIDSEEKVNSYTFFISEIKKVSFSSPELQTISVEVILNNNNKTIGLKYPVRKKEITIFFQGLDNFVVKSQEIARGEK